MPEMRPVPADARGEGARFDGGENLGGQAVELDVSRALDAVQCTFPAP